MITGKIGSSFVDIIFVLMGVFIFIWGAWSAKNGKASEEWADASGFIIKSYIKAPDGDIATARDKFGRFQTKIIYQYTAGGRLYSGSNIAFGDFSIRSRKQAITVSQKYPEGKRITIYYDPDNPGNSVLEPGISMNCYGFMGLGFTAMAAGIFTRIAGLKRDKG